MSYRDAVTYSKILDTVDDSSKKRERVICWSKVVASRAVSNVKWLSSIEQRKFC